MTQDEIIDMARKAWITSYCAAELKRGGVVDIDLENLEAFAKLVAAKEREACAKDAEWCIQNHLEHLMPERIRARGEQA